MKNRRLSACALLIVCAVGCATPRTAPLNPADNLSPLVGAVAASRARLDSIVLGIHKLSGDTTNAAIARSRQLRARAAKLDSSYRESVVDLLTTIAASTSGEPKGSLRFPIENSGTPFVRAFADGANWMLQSPLIYQVGQNPADVIIVPRGFITDFASVPQPLRALRDLMPSTDRYGIPSLVHDYLYWRQDCTREEADNIMEIALKEAGVSLLERKLVHEGIRQFGQSAWDENKRARESGLVRTVGAPYDEIPLTGTWAEYRNWLRTVRAKEGVEYPIPRMVCSAAGAP